VVRFVIEHEESWIPAGFRKAMDDAAQGKMVDMERMIGRFGSGTSPKKTSRDNVTTKT
jgi:hypothetical protein